METVDNWAAIEFGCVNLGDKRRTARLIQLANVLGNSSQASLPQATKTTATLKAAYRFFDNSAIEASEILAGHVTATYARLRQVARVLAVQDTTYLDWTAHPATQGLGPLASADQQGLLAHSTLAMTEERVPLGLLAQQVWSREAETFGKLADHKRRAFQDKESSKWVKSLAAVEAARVACPKTQFISVGDREADIYDLFVAERPAGVDLLVRAAMDRRVEQPERYVWAAVKAEPVTATVQVQVPPRADQPARRATLQVRWRAITLCPPRKRRPEHLPSVKLWAVWAVEPTPPPGVKAVEWMLLTTVPVQQTADALERLEWYACRWGIEVWHKVLKSGCQIEARQLETADRLKRCLTLYAVIAWRILYATMVSRAAPTLPCTVVLEAAEWEALYCTIQNTTRLPEQPPTLEQAIRWIAQLGGFQNRKSDGPPGVTVLWRGFQHLADLTRMYRVFRSQSQPPKNVGKD